MISNLDVKSLIEKILVINPKNRITIDEMLDHPWLKDNNLQDNNITYEINESLNDTNSTAQPKSPNLYNAFEYDGKSIQELMVLERLSKAGFDIDFLLNSINNDDLNPASGIYYSSVHQALTSDISLTYDNNIPFNDKIKYLNRQDQQFTSSPAQISIPRSTLLSFSSPSSLNTSPNSKTSSPKSILMSPASPNLAHHTRAIGNGKLKPPPHYRRLSSPNSAHNNDTFQLPSFTCPGQPIRRFSFTNSISSINTDTQISLLHKISKTTSVDTLNNQFDPNSNSSLNNNSSQSNSTSLNFNKSKDLDTSIAWTTDNIEMSRQSMSEENDIFLSTTHSVPNLPIDHDKSDKITITLSSIPLKQMLASDSDSSMSSSFQHDRVGSSGIDRSRSPARALKQATISEDTEGEENELEKTLDHQKNYLIDDRSSSNLKVDNSHYKNQSRRKSLGLGQILNSKDSLENSKNIPRSIPNSSNESTINKKNEDRIQLSSIII